VPVKTSNPCAAALRSFAAGDLAAWTGLPIGCTDADLAGAFPASNAGVEAGDGRLSNTPAKFRMYSAVDPLSPVQAWFDAADAAFLITWDAPTIAGDVASLLSVLGAPDRKLDPGVGYHADAHQWIYASRGLTLWVREHRTDVARVAVYAPTTPDDYEARLGGRDKTRYERRR
jgi:hypothetical protein